MHEPEASRLPKCVSEWQRVFPDTQYFDGAQLLVALPMWNGDKKSWRYDFHVVHVRCDEHYFSLEDSSGEPFGWEICDVDFYVELSGASRSA